jgi:C1A family cysteine protease
MFKYDISKVFKKPSFKCYWESVKHQITQYYRVPQTLNDIRGCLASGFPIIFGFSVYESFESQSVEESGIVSVPKKTERLIGSHVALCIGYNDNIGRFIIQNSWGYEWGMKGYFYMPYEYILNQNLSSDFWIIK